MRGEGRPTRTLGGIGVKTGDCAGPGQTSQTGVHRLQTFSKHGLAWSTSNREMVQSLSFTLLLVLISLLWELLLLWRFFTFRNMAHHDEPQVASPPWPQRPEVCYDFRLFTPQQRSVKWDWTTFAWVHFYETNNIYFSDSNTLVWTVLREYYRARELWLNLQKQHSIKGIAILFMHIKFWILQVMTNNHLHIYSQVKNQTVKGKPFNHRGCK